MCGGKGIWDVSRDGGCFGGCAHLLDGLHPPALLPPPLIQLRGHDAPRKLSFELLRPHPGLPFTAPSALPSKHPPCSKMSPLTVMSRPSSLAIGAEVSMHRRMGDEYKRPMRFSTAHLSAPAPYSSLRNRATHSACLNPTSVREGSLSRSGFISEGCASALLALCAWRTTYSRMARGENRRAPRRRVVRGGV